MRTDREYAHNLKHVGTQRARFCPPRSTSALIARPSLSARVENGGKLTLLLAPPGSGKSTLLAQWSEHSRTRHRIAWLLCGQRDRVPEDVLRFGRLEIDRAARQIRLDGEERPLTGYQYTLLLALAERAGRVLSRDTLMDLTKGHALEEFDRSIDVHISRIRAAIEDDPKKPRRILTVRGAGYVFAKEQDRL